LPKVMTDHKRTSIRHRQHQTPVSFASSLTSFYGPTRRHIREDIGPRFSPKDVGRAYSVASNTPRSTVGAVRYTAGMSHSVHWTGAIKVAMNAWSKFLLS
jgi:hypothetical protein